MEKKDCNRAVDAIDKCSSLCFACSNGVELGKALQFTYLKGTRTRKTRWDSGEWLMICLIGNRRELSEMSSKA